MKKNNAVKEPGKLILIATPIGNLEDITERARKALAETEVLACEDTRRTGRMLKMLGLKPGRLISCHDHNKEARAPQITDMLKGGCDVGLVTDAGCPSISDPGFYMVRKALKEGLEVISLPGPSAIITALQVSGLPTDSFVFYGYIPSKRADRMGMFRELEGERRTAVLYESPHRLIISLEELVEYTVSRRLTVARELTKLNEEHIRGTAGEVAALLAERSSLKGEMTIVVEGAKKIAESKVDAKMKRRYRFLTEDVKLKPGDAVRLISKETGISRNSLYRELKVNKKADRSPPSS